MSGTSRLRGRRRNRTGDLEELIETVYDHERRIAILERHRAQNRISGPLRWNITPLPGGQYTVSIFNESTGGATVIATI